MAAAMAATAEASPRQLRRRPRGDQGGVTTATTSASSPWPWRRPPRRPCGDIGGDHGGVPAATEAATIARGTVGTGGHWRHRR